MHQCGALLCHRCTSEAQEDQQRLVKLIFNGYTFLLASVFFPFSIANQLANEPTNQKLLASQPASQPIKRSVNWLVDQSIHRLTVRLLENQILIRVSWVTVNNSVRQKETDTRTDRHMSTARRNMENRSFNHSQLLKSNIRVYVS